MPDDINSICPICGGDQVVGNIAKRMGYRPDVAFARVRRLEDELFKRGAMCNPPCFCCGYSGPGYYQPDKHPCAERHHLLFNASAASPL